MPIKTTLKPLDFEELNDKVQGLDTLTATPIIQKAVIDKVNELVNQHQSFVNEYKEHLIYFHGTTDELAEERAYGIQAGPELVYVPCDECVKQKDGSYRCSVPDRIPGFDSSIHWCAKIPE